MYIQLITFLTMFTYGHTFKGKTKQLNCISPALFFFSFFFFSNFAILFHLRTITLCILRCIAPYITGLYTAAS